MPVVDIRIQLNCLPQFIDSSQIATLSDQDLCQAEMCRVRPGIEAQEFTKFATRSTKIGVLKKEVGEGLANLGRCRRNQMQGDWDGAFEEFSESKRLLPGLPETHNRLAWNFYHSEDGENAIAEARTALSIDPRNAVAYRFLGLGFYSNGMSEAALHAFEQSLLFEPENRDTFYDIGLTLQAQNYENGAMGAFRHAIKLDPELWEAHYQLAAIFLARGRFERAIEEYGYAKRLVPAETKIREALADLYFQNGDFSAASREFSQLLSLNSRSDTAH